LPAPPRPVLRTGPAVAGVLRKDGIMSEPICSPELSLATIDDMVAELRRRRLEFVLYVAHDIVDIGHEVGSRDTAPEDHVRVFGDEFSEKVPAYKIGILCDAIGMCLHDLEQGPGEGTLINPRAVKKLLREWGMYDGEAIHLTRLLTCVVGAADQLAQNLKPNSQ
jgi:hypothetical protein